MVGTAVVVLMNCVTVDMLGGSCGIAYWMGSEFAGEVGR